MDKIKKETVIELFDSLSEYSIDYDRILELKGSELLDKINLKFSSNSSVL